MMERKHIGSALYLNGERSCGVDAGDENFGDFQVNLPCGEEWQWLANKWDILNILEMLYLKKIY